MLTLTSPGIGQSQRKGKETETEVDEPYVWSCVFSSGSVLSRFRYVKRVWLAGTVFSWTNRSKENIWNKEKLFSASFSCDCLFSFCQFSVFYSSSAFSRCNFLFSCLFFFSHHVDFSFPIFLTLSICKDCCFFFLSLLPFHPVMLCYFHCNNECAEK